MTAPPVPRMERSQEDRGRDAEPSAPKEKDAMAKLHPTLATAFAMQSGAASKVKVYVHGDFNEAAKMLVALGVEILEQRTAEGYMLVRTVNGKLPVIARLKQVRYVSPNDSL